jgi:hypothetical protein
MSDVSEQAEPVRKRWWQFRRKGKDDSRESKGACAAYDATFAIERDKKYLVHNRTPNRIRVHDDDYGDIWLAPLARREFEGERLAPFALHLRPLRQRHQVRVRESTPTHSPSWSRFVVWLVALAALGAVVFDVLAYGTLRRPEALLTTSLFAAVVLAVLGFAAGRERRRIDRAHLADCEEGDVELGLGDAWYNGNDTGRQTKYVTMLAIVIVAGAVLPAIAIFVATDAKSFLSMQGGLAVEPGVESRLVSRLIQIVYTAVLSLFPALMYFQFDRQRVGTIRGGWIRAIFRMDPQMETLADIDARYGDRLGEASSFSTDSSRFLGGRYSPIVVATILISLGWTLLVLPTKSYDYTGTNEIATLVDATDSAANQAQTAADNGSASDAQAAAAEADRSRDAAAAIAAESTGTSTTSASAPTVPEDADQAADAAAADADAAREAEDSVALSFFQLVDPTPSAATMAFLGAYFFAVYLVLRGYFQGDLRPKIYNQITARLVTVVVIAYLINVVLEPSGVAENVWWATAFLAGVVPITVLQGFGQLMSSVLGNLPRFMGGWLNRAFADTFATPRALTKIDGIDIYESARLESDGITDIPSLATTDLVSMMVNTRMPVERLVDWSDQAMLVLLVEQGENKEAHDGERDDDNEAAGEPAKEKAALTQLRGMGIRTASSLCDVAHDPKQKGRRAKAAAILGGEPLLEGLASQIENEPSTRRILQWRKAELTDLCASRPVITARRPRPCGSAALSGNGSHGAPERAAPRAE